MTPADTAANAVTYRADYQALAWTVEHVDLHINLEPQATLVSSMLKCVRNPALETGALVLFGEDMVLESLRINGLVPLPDQMMQYENRIELLLQGDSADIALVTRINPSANLTLSGLYRSNGGYFTQCEAEGFRRITYFPDRPDVMARYSVTLEADQQTCPVLLSNGNLKEQGELANGRHYARWEDPFPKPSYLFALVAAQLVALERHVRTMSGREVLLQVWVEARNQDRAEHAMTSLIHAVRWDEEIFGLELDLDRFMIVAVSDFNMGAMENKGLNIFNDKYVLAKPDTATDIDYENIESVVAHEYFHNWTGNRVTCRDWFQLTLKEGLTVFRDQQFSADMLAAAAGEAGAASARAVKRIDDVRMLRTAQFSEDNGPMAHPIRPDSYQEINNFYTATVYEKGAEIIRMQHTLLGQEGFRKGMNLYFRRHDGQAVTCDDFIACMADANERDLQQFMHWYSQAGTPHLKVSTHYDAAGQRYTLVFEQTTLPTPGQPHKQALLIPVAIGLIGRDGTELPLHLESEKEGEKQAGETTRILELTQTRQTFCFINVAEAPVPSLLRNFSAPVMLELEESDEQLAFRMAHDADAFNRWDAAQRYTERVILALTDTIAAGRAALLPETFIEAYAMLLGDEKLDPAFRTQTATLPGEIYLLERMDPANPAVLRQALMATSTQLGARLADQWLQLHQTMALPGDYRYHPADAGKRALGNLALKFLAAADNEKGLQLAQTQFELAKNMTDRIGALTALLNSRAGGAAGAQALADFYTRYRDDALVLDKWFALQAGAWRWNEAEKDGQGALERVCELMQNPAFNLSNPNKVYALLGSFFRGNPAEFHLPDGRGYAFWAEQVIALNRNNPQLASRMARALENWRGFPENLQALIKPQLMRVGASPGLSPDVAEIIAKALAA